MVSGRSAATVLAAGSLLAIGFVPSASAAAVPGPRSGHSAPAPVRTGPDRASTASTADGTTLSVVLQLADADPRAMASLASAKHLTRTQRASLLAKAGPKAVTRNAVAARLRALGLAVTSQSRFSVTASGPAAAVNASFGESPTRSPGGRVGESTSGGTVVPASLTGLVKFAVSSAQAGPLVRPLMARGSGTPQPATTLAPGTNEVDGAIARTLYGAPADSGTITTPKLTIATIQFSGWNAADLTTYAATQVPGVGNPVASGQYTPVSVNGANPTLPDGGGGDVEVALDQESLLATAPNAAQRAYFVNNGPLSDYISALNQIATDAGTVTPPLTALSISWGGCELAYQPSDIAALDSAFQSLAAAGVTTFAAAGDSGAFDCDRLGAQSPVPPGTPTVDYPAASPYVIGVGGLSTTTATPTNPTESVWWDSASASGGGGGQSAYESRPAWQPASPPGTKRLVPDISLAADPNAGYFQIYTSDSAACSGLQWCGVGGTSLASPLAAATLTDLEMSLGARVDGQLGLISPQLYTAQRIDNQFNLPSSSRGFRDVLVGTNGHFVTAKGYDEASGLGAPNWSNLSGWLINGLKITTPAYSKSHSIPIVSVSTPTIAASGQQSAGYSAGVGPTPASCPTPTSASAPSSASAGSDGIQTVWIRYRASDGTCEGGFSTTLVDTLAPAVTVTAGLAPATGTTAVFRWRGNDGTNGSGVATFNVTLRRIGVTAPVISLVGTLTTSLSLPLARGATYAMTVNATDRAGNRSKNASSAVSVPLSLASFRMSSGWTSIPTSLSIAGMRYGSDRYRATGSVTYSARSYRLLVTTCPTCGFMAVYVDGTYRKTISTYSAVTHNLVALYAVAFATPGRHTISVTVLHQKVWASRGSAVVLDGLTAIS